MMRLMVRLLLRADIAGEFPGVKVSLKEKRKLVELSGRENFFDKATRQ